MEDDLFYLDFTSEPDFMPSTLRAVDLRSLLLQHNIAYPMRATKPELVEIFKEKVIANASEILQNHKQTGSRPAFSQLVQNVDDTWSSGDEAPINLIKQKEEIAKAQGRSPKRSTRQDVTTSPKRPRKPRKLQFTDEPISSAQPEEYEQSPVQPEVHVESKEREKEVVKAKKDSAQVDEAEKKDTFAKPTKPAPRKPRVKKPRADRSWIKPKAVHSGLTSDSDSDFGDRQRRSERASAVETIDKFPNFLDKSLLDLPHKHDQDTGSALEHHQIEPKIVEIEPDRVLAFPAASSSPASPSHDNLRRSLRLRRANSKETNIFDHELLDINLDQAAKIAENGEESTGNEVLQDETVITTYETIVTEAEADDEAEPSAVALAKGKQRAKKHRQKKTKKPSPRLCQLLGIILTFVVFWYFISHMTLPKTA